MESVWSGETLKYVWEGAQTLQVLVTNETQCSSLYLIYHQSVAEAR